MEHIANHFAQYAFAMAYCLALVVMVRRMHAATSWASLITISDAYDGDLRALFRTPDFREYVKSASTVFVSQRNFWNSRPLY